MVENTGKYLTLNRVTAYTTSFSLANDVWGLVLSWDYFAKQTVGMQFARAIDSISANIAEGFGRYGKKDKVHFYRIARGSVYESLDWLEKAKRRELIDVRQYEKVFRVLSVLPKDINVLIKYTNEKLSI